jgi:two-component system sensor histidine kinase HydH
MPVKPQTFNLRLWFGAGSFGTIAVICLLGAFWVSHFLTSGLLERETEVSQEFIESIVTVDGSAMFHDDDTEPYVAKPALLDFAKHIVSMPDIIRVNIYAATHRVLWSTDKRLIGKKFDINDELDDAFKGERVAKVGMLPDGKLEHVGLGRNGRFIEAYIPIHADGGRGPLLAVVEFYKQPLALNAAIERAQHTVWLVAGGAALVLFLALYWIVARGARLIEQQHERLGHMEAFAAIGQMASAVAHSLRNPMSAIRSSAELWQTDQPSGRCEIADNVIHEVDRMDAYVRDLLAYAKSDNYQPQPVDPWRVVETILVKQRASIDRNNIEIETRADRAAVRDVLADEMLLEQALTSVVTNAVEAMPEGGTLAISIDASDKDVRIEIADTGRGIPAELMQRVRESYFTTKTRGLGLGLALATSIIERFHGRLDIGSTPDRGTRVSIALKPANLELADLKPA